MSRESDEAYWANYYKTGAAPETPSDFANFVMSGHLAEGDQLIELGCGNGRDARFFAGKGVGVLAVDLCAPEIAELARRNVSDNLTFEAGDFTAMPDADEPFDAVYSRFTLHSVDAEGQGRALAWASRNLKPDGHLFIETRGQKNEIFGLGEPVDGEEDAFVYEEHYRRFVDFDKFVAEVAANGFMIKEAEEAQGFAPHQGTDYHFIRVIAQSV